MVKIWEVDFTQFDPPSSTSGIDNVGDQNLNGPVSVAKIASLPDFSFRPGVNWSLNGTDNYYDLLSGGNTRAGWNSSYSPTNKRSFVMWIYPKGIPEVGCTLWGDGNNIADIIADNGWANGNNTSIDEDLVYRYDDTASSIVVSDFFTDINWHCLIATIDRVNGEQRAYVDGSLVFSVDDINSIPNTTRNISRIGDWSSIAENNMYLGYVATYDHILTPTEVTEIFNTFLRDSAAGEVPLHTISGTVYGLDNTPISGAMVYLIRESGNYIEYYTSTSGNGYYEVPISFSGSYTLVSTNTPDSGGRAQPILSTTGSLVFL